MKNKLITLKKYLNLSNFPIKQYPIFNSNWYLENLLNANSEIIENSINELTNIKILLEKSQNKIFGRGKSLTSTFLYIILII